MTADHDRNVGPRGEEEAPRGPAPSTERLTYGELPPEAPLDHVDDQPEPAAPRSVLRRRDFQLIGAGVAGLVLGVLLGGSLVAALDDRGDREHPSVRWHGPVECYANGVPCSGPINPFKDGGRLESLPVE
ncbi:hypothetical protein ACIBH1_19065 [Nonomuraea sp. NPDC050663]|uniref:hypothetical protein n=1 Tax=Nonomuraea sp. NPDC050663 TaxID=3364370 RepID=UPI00378BEAAE